MAKLTVVLTKEGNKFIAFCPSFGHIVTPGATEEKAIRVLRETIKQYLAKFPKDLEQYRLLDGVKIRRINGKK